MMQLFKHGCHYMNVQVYFSRKDRAAFVKFVSLVEMMSLCRLSIVQKEDAVSVANVRAKQHQNCEHNHQQIRIKIF